MAGGMRGGGGGNSEEEQNRFQQRAERNKLLEISHEDPEVLLSFADGFERKLYTDGRELPDDLENGFFESTAKWKGNSKLVVEAESMMGQVTEIYELAEDGDQLYVTTKMEGDRRRPSIGFKRVYERTLVDLASDNSDSPSPSGLVLCTQRPGSSLMRATVRPRRHRCERWPDRHLLRGLRR